MEHSPDDYTVECDPFTFPQVKPLYSKLLAGSVRTGRSTRKPLKRPNFLEDDLPELTEHQAKIPDDEDESLSVNSLSGDLQQHCNIKTNNKVNERSRFNLMTPHPSDLQAHSTVKRSAFVKRILKTPSSKSSENAFPRDSKFSQHSIDFDVLPKVKEDKLDGVNRGNKDERVLRDVLNYNLKSEPEKFVASVKTPRDPKCAINGDKGAFIIPSIITYRKDAGIPDVSKKSPKAANRMTPGLHQSIRSCTTKLQYRNGNREFLEKPKQIFSGMEKEIPEIKKSNPSIIQRADPPSILSVNNVEYTILSKLGQGGSSQVYQVLDRQTSNLLAVKCVNLVDADEATAMGYLKEIELLLRLQSSNRVIKLIDHEYLKQKQILYVVMEKGDTDLSTLLKIMTKSGDVSLPMVIYYWTEMLHAVKEIHDNGIVHADLKPANFLLVCGRLKLIDFGIASAIQTDATSVIKSSMLGTCNYMSPETIQDPSDSSRTKVGYKSDVWSLGCILYNLLYRKTPFQHITNNLRKFQMIANPNHRIEYPPVEKCPPPLMDALKSCLAYDSKKRPTVAQLLAIDYIWPTSY